MNNTTCKTCSKPLIKQQKKYCSDECRIRGARLSYSQVEKEFNDRGFELLSQEYINSHTKLQYRCSQGHIGSIAYAGIQKGRGCLECSGNRKYTIQEVKQYFADYGYQLLSTQYENAHKQLRYRCPEGHTRQITFSRFKTGQRCSECAGKGVHSYENVKKAFEKANCVLLSKKYEAVNKKLDYVCSCGTQAKISWQKFQQGQRCRQCSFQKIGDVLRLSHAQIKIIFEEAGCTLLSTEYKDNQTKLDYICSCGREAKITLANFKKGARCMKCANEARSGKNSYLWDFTLTDEERKETRCYPEYREWRKSIFERDNYTCQCCLDRGNKIHAHHIFGYKEHKELRLKVDNGITLCKECHNDFHRFYSYNNTAEQLAEFIKDSKKALIAGVGG